MVRAEQNLDLDPASDVRSDVVTGRLPAAGGREVIDLPVEVSDYHNLTCATYSPELQGWESAQAGKIDFPMARALAREMIIT